MGKDYPRMRRFWWILFSIIGGLWTLYGAFAMVIGLIVDPVERWLMLGAIVICGAFAVALVWTPTRRLAIRHPVLLYTLGAAMIGGGLYCLFRDWPPAFFLYIGMALMLVGIQVLMMPWLLRHEREKL